MRARGWVRVCVCARSCVCGCVCVCVCARARAHAWQGRGALSPLPCLSLPRRPKGADSAGSLPGQRVLPDARGHHLLLLPGPQVPECFRPSYRLWGLCFLFPTPATDSCPLPARWRKARSSSQSPWSLGERLCRPPRPLGRSQGQEVVRAPHPPPSPPPLGAEDLSACISTSRALRGAQDLPDGAPSPVPADKATAPHSSTPARKIPWTEGPGGLQSMGSLRVGHD